jgi:hypothetical protein
MLGRLPGQARSAASDILSDNDWKIWPCLAEGWLVLYVPQHRQHEGQRLPAACFGHPDAVAPAHDDRECLGLQGTVVASLARLAWPDLSKMSDAAALSAAD